VDIGEMLNIVQHQYRESYGSLTADDFRRIEALADAQAGRLDAAVEKLQQRLRASAPDVWAAARLAVAVPDLPEAYPNRPQAPPPSPTRTTEKPRFQGLS
jgi:hypothetical protein